MTTIMTACVAHMAMLTLRLRWSGLTVCVTDVAVIWWLQVCIVVELLSAGPAQVSRRLQAARLTLRMLARC